MLKAKGKGYDQSQEWRWREKEKCVIVSHIYIFFFNYKEIVASLWNLKGFAHAYICRERERERDFEKGL